LIIKRTRYLTQGIAKILIWMGALSTIALMILILFQILREGACPSSELLSRISKRNGREGGIFSTIVGTVALTLVAIVVGAPLGVGTAIF